MALPPSPLSIAADALAEAIAAHLTANGEDAVVSVDTPAAAAERAKGTAAKPAINLFFYRLAGSGIQAGVSAGEPLLLTLFCLVTAFVPPGSGAGLAELRLLGEAVRFFHSNPVLGPLPPADPANAAMMRYSIAAVLQQPPMEELNHIWGTQGTETAYRLSAAFELGLVPVEPLVKAVAAPPVVAASYDVRTDAADDPRAPSLETAGLARIRPLGGPAADWLPLALLRDGDRLSTALTLARTATQLPAVVTGPPGERARFVLRFIDAGGAELEAVTRQRTIISARLDDPDAQIALDISAPAAARRIDIAVTPIVAGGAGGQQGHPLTVTLT